MNFKVAIIGAGITGLSTAWHLKKNGLEDFILIERDQSVGGKIETYCVDDCLIEAAADSFVTTKPYALNLIQEIGLQEEVIYPKTTAFQILTETGFLNPPKGLFNLTPIDEVAFQSSNFFTEVAKKDIFNERNVEKIEAPDIDESFSSFITRRFGKEMLDKYAGPLFKGIYATHPEEMSLQATFPHLKDWENEYGSIWKAVQTKFPNHKIGESRSTFAGLKNGMGSLALAVKEKLEDYQLLLDTSIKSVKKDNQGYEIVTDRFTIKADVVVITTPLYLIPDFFNRDKHIHDLVSGFDSAGSYIINYVLDADKEDNLPQTTGFISSDSYKGLISAGTYTSNKWEGRCKKGQFLMRLYIPKTEELACYTSFEINQLVFDEIAELLSLKHKYLNSYVYDWSASLPQYKLGHLERVNTLNQYFKNNYPNIHLGGSYFKGVGIPDCIKQGIDLANNIINRL